MKPRESCSLCWSGPFHLDVTKSSPGRDAGEQRSLPHFPGPALVREVPDEAVLAMSLIENIQREDLNPLEEALGIQRLIKEFGMTHEAASQALGISRSAVSNLLRLLNLPPPVQELLMEGKIDMGHGRALLSLPPAKQIEIANFVAHKQLSVRETEKLVYQIERPAPKAKRPPKNDRDLLSLQEDVSAKLGAQVVIKPGKKGAGTVVIHDSSLDQLDGYCLAGNSN